MTGMQNPGSVHNPICIRIRESRERERGDSVKAFAGVLSRLKVLNDGICR